MLYSQHSSFYPRDFILSLWVSLHFVIVYAAVLPIDYHLLQTNRTLFAGSNDIEVHCSNDKSWVDSRAFFDPKDCFGSIYFMLHEEHAEAYQEEKPVVFVSHPIHPAYKHEGIQNTPRKYSPRTYLERCLYREIECSDALATLPN